MKKEHRAVLTCARLCKNSVRDETIILFFQKLFIQFSLKAGGG